MPKGIHNPLPSSLKSECKKAAKILASFTDPKSFSPDKNIPLTILAGAKGLAVFTIAKVGFLGSARFGSGLVVARLADGSWSAPSAIVSAGVGFGGQIGMELTDFVFVLNTTAAVQTFSQFGSLTLGGNLSIATGPIGRNLELTGAASAKGVTAAWSYAKTRGLFVGVSLEGGILVERRLENERLYGRKKITARQLLNGTIPPPPAAERLMHVLSSPAFTEYMPTELPAQVPVELPLPPPPPEAPLMSAELPAESSREMPPELLSTEVVPSFPEQRTHPQIAELPAVVPEVARPCPYH